MDEVASIDAALARNPRAHALLAVAAGFALPNWYLGGGAVAQSFWNVAHGFEPTEGIKDYDLVYFDPDDLSAATEQRLEGDIARRVPDLEGIVDVTNEARVHLWYEQRFGRHLDPYRSTEEAIATWPTTAASVGVRVDDGSFVVYAPFGLTDLVDLIVRPNKSLVSRNVYEAKAARWKARWPKLTVLPW